MVTAEGHMVNGAQAWDVPGGENDGGGTAENLAEEPWMDADADGADAVGTLAVGTAISACADSVEGNGNRDRLHPQAWKISNPITGECLAKDPDTGQVKLIKMDTFMPRPPRNHSAFDDSEGEWEEEPSDNGEEFLGPGEEQEPEPQVCDGVDAADALKRRWNDEFVNPAGKDLGWRIDQEQEWWSEGAAGYDRFFGVFVPSQKLLGLKPGYVFKTCHLGLGYYLDRPGRIPICLVDATSKPLTSPMKLLLNDMVAGGSKGVGDLLAATTMDEVAEETSKKGKRKKPKKVRRTVEGPNRKPVADTGEDHTARGVQWIDQLTV